MSNSDIITLDEYKKITKEMEMILDYIPALVIYKDTENNFIRVNKYVADAHNMSKEQLEGKNLFELYPREEAQAYWDDDLEVISSRQPKLNIVEPWETEKGRRWVLTSRMPHIDEDGNVKGTIVIANDITERMIAEEKLKQAHSELDQIFNASLPMYVVDKDFNILRVNDTYCSLLKKKKEDILEKKCYDVWKGPNCNTLRCSLCRILECQDEFEYEVDVELEGGYNLSLIVKTVPYRSADGKIVGAIKTLIDITERKNAEKAVLNERDNFYNILNSMEDGIYIVNQQYDIEYVNPSLIAEFGTYEGKKCYTYFSDRIEVCPWCKNQDVIKGKTVRWEWYSSKTQKTYDLIDTPLKNPDGTISKLEIFRDITERKKMEEELHLKDIVFKSSISAQSTADINGIITDVNPAFLELWGYKSKEEAIGNSVSNFFVNNDDAVPVFEALNQTGKWEGEFLAKKCDGLTFISQGLATAIYNEKGEHIGYQSANLNITAEKEYQKQLKETMEELKRSNAELEQFAYVASHDLQEPLRMVASFTQLLQKRYQDKLDQDANEFINFAVDGTTRMQSLINDLLIFSRVGTRGKPFKVTDMNVILQDVLNNVMQSIKDTNAIITNDPLPVIIADDSQMIQLLQNLISNAIKFHGDEPPRIHMSGEGRENEWVFSVKDNGIGIDSKYFDKIFIIFQRLHKKTEYGGTGIGLAICKKIVQRHGGKIWVDSEVGKGATFYFAIKKNDGGKLNN